ncbi:hypothetical protein [Edwardsiella ictaluri]|uniref:hypothetical protein n=1 Tax=Edwardsiella ictaluri TaxID=67780 RepID=UPI00257480A6|nr:hypothetical protein [Edwardsiella ictaluri]BEH98639.1 hypothetical protein KH20906_13670 [Edwardsiella ictaluri]BEI02133.1 hypothetical protein KB20921_13940 [Edwardsiella ictaluri]BEI05602.1 hypothetical protein KH201010_13880 [Edwardsiella ictaluri]BEI09058.1 hypothetical protein STU22726_13890 [Edwardsiella ictaluri]BEI12538.1 hypothetical protein STU22816_13910 [Edwardsiella ictaluri]
MAVISGLCTLPASDFQPKQGFIEGRFCYGIGKSDMSGDDLRIPEDRRVISGKNAIAPDPAPAGSDGGMIAFIVEEATPGFSLTVDKGFDFERVSPAFAA